MRFTGKHIAITVTPSIALHYSFHSIYVYIEWFVALLTAKQNIQQSFHLASIDHPFSNQVDKKQVSHQFI